MRKRIAMKWIAALRSGKYAQGREKLRTLDDKFCGLGVLCDLYAKEHGAVWRRRNDWGAWEMQDSVNMPPNDVINWAGMNTQAGTISNAESLVAETDSGTPFPVIADIIEDNWAAL